MRRLLGVGELSTDELQGSITLRIEHDHTDEFPTESGPVAVLKNKHGVEVVPLSDIVATTSTATVGKSTNAKRVRGIKEIVRNLQDQDGVPGAPESEIVELAEGAGYDRGETLDTLRRLADKGEVYVPAVENSEIFHRVI